MKTLINGKSPVEAIAEEAIRQIQELNPSINPADYEKPEDIPGFLDIMKKRCGINIDKTDTKRYMAIRQKMNRLEKRRKTAVLDFRRHEDGRTTLAALANIRNKLGKLELQELWEEEIGWDVFIER